MIGTDPTLTNKTLKTAHISCAKEILYVNEQQNIVTYQLMESQ